MREQQVEFVQGVISDNLIPVVRLDVRIYFDGPRGQCTASYAVYDDANDELVDMEVHSVTEVFRGDASGLEALTRGLAAARRHLATF